MKKTQQDIDYKWFVDNINDLFFNYGYSYVAIKNKKVVGVYSTLIDGIKDMKSKHQELGTFIIQKCAPSIEDTYEKVASMDFMVR